MDTSPEIDRLLSNPSPNSIESAVELMVAAYQTSLYRLACSILRDADEAEDALQHTFLAASSRLESYRPGSNFRAWLFTIAVNSCRGMLRRRKVRQAFNQLLGRAYSPDGSFDLEHRLLQNEAASQLWSAVDALDEKHRLVVHLRFVQDLTIAEIAQVLSIPEKTVYSRLYDAYHKLRTQLSYEWDQEAQAELFQKEATP